jgi:hypothetical protein
VPIVVFGFMATVFLSQERAYRDLFVVVVEKLRTGKYTLANVFEANAPLRFAGCLETVWSWAILPIYLGLTVTCFVTYFSRMAVGARLANGRLTALRLMFRGDLQ